MYNTNKNAETKPCGQITVCVPGYLNVFLKINQLKKFIIFMTSQTETSTINTKVYQLIQYFCLEILSPQIIVSEKVYLSVPK